MADSDNSIPKKWGTTLKVVSVACALLLIGLAIFNFAALNIGDPIDIILPIYYM
jgi:hypothetical protein